ncbi:hypothetical protein DY000_02038499 [Brassica cretica]|uniref:BHLH domain-containing protein n=1 Tax=Brassica cretica TaxID=69181 RepID=A0ABQ7BPP5_BRACR|nr:hypothetical protein DY000_02038499 [Brassica cretica]
MATKSGSSPEEWRRRRERSVNPRCRKLAREFSKQTSQRKEGRDQDEDEMIIESNCVLRKMLRSRGGGTQTHRDVV